MWRAGSRRCVLYVVDHLYLTVTDTKLLYVRSCYSMYGPAGSAVVAVVVEEKLAVQSSCAPSGEPDAPFGEVIAAGSRRRAVGPFLYLRRRTRRRGPTSPHNFPAAGTIYSLRWNSQHTQIHTRPYSPDNVSSNHSIP